MPLPPSSLPAPIAEALTRGTVVLTANQRAAHSLRAAAADTPNALILPLEAWLRQLWHGLLLAGEASLVLLNRSQEHTLWRDLIDADPDVAGLRSADALAEMAATAWRQLCLYGGHGRLSEPFSTPDTQAFQRWGQIFDRATSRAGHLSEAQLAAALTAAVRSSRLPLPGAGLLLVDFDRLPPAHTALIEAIRDRDVPVVHLQLEAPSRQMSLHEATNARAEREAVARWIRERLIAEPGIRIAVVVPDLTEAKPELTRIFSQILKPELNRFDPAHAGQQTGPFEFSLGMPLTETPPVAVALDLLRLTQTPLPLPAISNLLLSPFFAATSGTPEHLAMAEFDVSELRESRMLRPELSLNGLIRLLQASPRRERLQPLLGRLNALRELAESAPPEASLQSHAFWSDHFRQLLTVCGWAAHAGSSSLAFQTHRRWESAVDELATLDFEGARTTAAEALAALTRIAQAIVFAPESHDAPVQVLGPLEPGGVRFDALWFLSAGDLTWPATPAVSPLLPFGLARSLAMPGTDPARDHAAACALTERIAGSTAEVIFSFAAELEDGHQHASSALAGLELTPYQPAPLPPPPEPLPLDCLPDDEPVPLKTEAVIRGGSTVLALQSACSFRAFAEQRLYSAVPGERTLGLNAGERGSLVHKVMQLFWTRLAGHAELLALPLDQRAEALNAAIDEGLRDTLRRARTPWDHAYLETQRYRLRLLLDPWLEVEAARPPFTVSRNEKEVEAELGPLKLSLRVDRVDDTPVGQVILDYKTGLATPSQWLGERPDAPQLPLYAILSEPPPAGVAFALLRAGEDLALKGFADSPSVFGKPTAMQVGMEEQLGRWFEVLAGLAEQFAAGEPLPDPKDHPSTCSYCAQRILCRLDPAALTEICDDGEPAPAEDPAYG